MISDIDKAYAAGLFDGEGSIGVSNQQRTGSRSASYHLRCKVAMCDREAAAFLHERWGGSLRLAPPTKASHRRSWIWVVGSKQAGAFLEDILPFLKLERVITKAMIGIEFQGQKRYGGQHDPEYLAFQRLFYEDMKELNRRGLAA